MFTFTKLTPYYLILSDIMSMGNLDYLVEFIFLFIYVNFIIINYN